MPETPSAAGINIQTEAALQMQELAKKHLDGASWFFWIAGLSLINSIVILSGAEWSFLIGLGITQIIDFFALGFTGEMGSQSKMIFSILAFALDAIVAATFILWGILARKQYRWAYIIGMILYALDGIIFLLTQDWPSFGFHIFALVCLFNGFKACGQLQQLAALSAATTPPPINQQP